MEALCRMYPLTLRIVSHVSQRCLNPPVSPSGHSRNLFFFILWGGFFRKKSALSHFSSCPRLWRNPSSLSNPARHEVSGFSFLFLSCFSLLASLFFRCVLLIEALWLVFSVQALFSSDLYWTGGKVRERIKAPGARAA